MGVYLAECQANAMHDLILHELLALFNSPSGQICEMKIEGVLLAGRKGDVDKSWRVQNSEAVGTGSLRGSA